MSGSTTVRHSVSTAPVAFSFLIVAAPLYEGRYQTFGINRAKRTKTQAPSADRCTQINQISQCPSGIACVVKAMPGSAPDTSNHREFGRSRAKTLLAIASLCDVGLLSELRPGE